MPKALPEDGLLRGVVDFDDRKRWPYKLTQWVMNQAPRKNMRKTVFLTAMFCAGHCNAQAINCEAVSHTKIPFELLMKSKDGKTFNQQVYRSDDLYTAIYVKGETGQKNKINRQGNFVLRSEIKFPSGKEMKISFKYSVPTDKFYWDRKINSFSNVVESAVTENGISKTTTTNNNVKIDYSNEEMLFVGPCAFKTKHYTTISESADATAESSVWFSPELDVPLRLQSHFKSKKRSFDNSSAQEAIDIKTTFIPSN